MNLSLKQIYILIFVVFALVSANKLGEVDSKLLFMAYLYFVGFGVSGAAATGLCSKDILKEKAYIVIPFFAASVACVSMFGMGYYYLSAFIETIPL